MTTKKWFFWIVGIPLFIGVASYSLALAMAFDWGSLAAKAKNGVGYGVRLQYQSRLIVEEMCVTNTVQALLADSRLTKDEKASLQGKDPSAVMVIWRQQQDWSGYGDDADKYDTVVQSDQTNTVSSWLSSEGLPEQVKESLRKLDLDGGTLIDLRLLKQTPR